jgi:leukotriene-A4 hydrolase
LLLSLTLRKIRHGEAYRHFSAIIGWKALSDAVALFGEHHEFTKLVIDLDEKDPDDAFSTVPYEKGFTFLFHLEKLLGIQNFDKFIPHVSRSTSMSISRKFN